MSAASFAMARVPRPLMNRATYDRLCDELAALPATEAVRVTLLPPFQRGTLKAALYLRFRATHHVHMRRAKRHDDTIWILWIDPKRRTS